MKRGRLRTYVRVPGSLYLREADLMRLDSLSNSTGRSRSELVREAVGEWLQEHGYATTTRSTS